MRRQHYTHTPLPAETNSDSGRMVTEYQANFFPHNALAVRQSRKPTDSYQHMEGKMANITIFRSDYVPHDVTRRPPKVTKAYVPPEGSMTHISSYMHDYKAYSIQQSIVTKTGEYHPPSVKMNAQSTYKDEFQSWDSHLHTSSNPKTGYTTAPDQDLYRPKASGAATTPAREEPLSTDSMTSYKLQYIPHPVQPKHTVQRVVYKPSSCPLSSVTTHRQDYRRTETTKPVRSKVTLENNATPFQVRPEFWDKYKTWPVRPMCQQRAVENLPPKDKVDFMCTTYADFDQLLTSKHTSTHTWSGNKLPPHILSDRSGACRPWEDKKFFSVAQTKVTDNSVGPLDNTTTTTFSPQDMLKTTVLLPSFQPIQREESLNCLQNDKSFAGLHGTMNIAKESQPCSVNVSAKGMPEADSNKLYRTLPARDSCSAHPVMIKSNKSKYSHSPKKHTVKSVVFSKRTS